ncbi:hypothetical protein IWQ61_006034, partial [Dispira simplex]
PSHCFTWRPAQALSTLVTAHRVTTIGKFPSASHLLVQRGLKTIGKEELATLPLESEIRFKPDGRVAVGDCYILTQPYPQNKIPDKAAGRHIKRFHFTKKRTERNDRLWKFYLKVQERNGMCYLKNRDYHFMLDRYVLQSKKKFKLWQDYSFMYIHKVELQADREEQNIIRTLCNDWLLAHHEAQRQITQITPEDWIVVFLGKPPPYLIQLDDIDFDRIALTFATLGDLPEALAVVEREMLPLNFYPSTTTVSQIIFMCAQQHMYKEAKAVFAQLDSWHVQPNTFILTQMIIIHVKESQLDKAEALLEQLIRKGGNVYHAFRALVEGYRDTGTLEKIAPLRSRLLAMGHSMTPPPRARVKPLPEPKKPTKRKLIFGGGRRV